MKRISITLILCAATLCAALALTGCAAQNVANTPLHNLRLANADLAAALNKVESTALTANQQGVITVAEAITVSQVINNLTIASDGIEKCADGGAAGGAVNNCVSPFIQSIQSQMTLAGLGIKSAAATATFTVVINGVLVTLTQITNAEAGLS